MEGTLRIKGPIPFRGIWTLAIPECSLQRRVRFTAGLKLWKFEGFTAVDVLRRAPGQLLRRFTPSHFGRCGDSMVVIQSRVVGNEDGDEIKWAHGGFQERYTGAMIEQSCSEDPTFESDL